MTNYLDLVNGFKRDIQKKRPLIHHITNLVTMHACARITSCLGASPIMAVSPHEVAEVTAKSQALVINTGTLHDDMQTAICRSLEMANKMQIPVVFDPVGMGLSAYRQDFIRHLLDTYQMTIIRCNASELHNLYGHLGSGQGIDSTAGGESLDAIIQELADQYKTTIVCTGETDYVQNGKHLHKTNRGTPLLPQLVGTGCMLNSLIAACLPMTKDPALAGIGGLLTMNLAGELAAETIISNEHLGTFETRLFDFIRPQIPLTLSADLLV